MSTKVKNRIIDCINVILIIIIIFIFPYVFPKEHVSSDLHDELQFIPEQNEIQNDVISKNEIINEEKTENKTPQQNEIINEEKIENKTPQQNEIINDELIETEMVYENNFMSNSFLVSYDNSFIPDKYNTGINRTKKLTIYDLDSMSNLNGINIVGSTTSSGGTTYLAAVISLYKNPDLSGEYVIENVDFSNYHFRVYSFLEYEHAVKIVFKNCKFNNINIAENMGDNVYFVFENCEFSHFSGSNSTFLNCKFGQGLADGINPFKNIIVKNSYIGNLAQFSESGTHLDGIQIFAREDIIASNIHFYNTRIDIPYIKPCINGVCSNASVNAPIMLQLEYNSGSNISFEKMYINGGGYSIYTRTLGGFTYSDVLFKDIIIGEGMLYKKIYPDITEEGLIMDNVVNSDKLLIGSVWKDSKGVHISTTNYTLIERKLVCETNKGVFKFNIKAHPKLTKENSTSYSFDELPYDINNIIKSTDITWIKCYDATIDSELTSSNLLISYIL